MADPLWIDSDVIMEIANGDTALEAELRQIRDAGSQLLMVPKVQQECTVGNPLNARAVRRGTDINSQNTVTRNAAVIQRLNIQLDTTASRSTMQDRVDLAERGAVAADGRPLPAQANVQPSDSQVLAQVTSSASARGVRVPRILSLDGGIQQNAGRWGVTAVPRASVPTPPTPGGGGGGGGPTTATSGDPWMGPGGTPGFNPGRIQNIGAALEMFQNWASQLSMLSAAIEAWNAIMAKEDEVIKIQNDDPCFPVYLAIYWRVFNENNPNLYKTWKFYGVEIKGGGAGKPEALYDADQKSYLMIIPARKAGGPARNATPARPATWRDTFVSIYATARGDRTTGGDAQKALGLLNGCPMYDILPILKEIRRADAQSLNLMEQALHWPTTNVGVDRLEAAFFAVRMSSNSGNPFAAYKAACKEFASLPADQQKDIENFLTGASAPTQTAMASPAGEWECRVGRFVWIYTFDDKGGVTWKDPFNGKTGQGSWRMGDTTMRITWQGSKSWDVWTLPLNPEKQGGSVSVDGEGIFSLRATYKKS